MKKILFILFIILNLAACNNDIKDSKSKDTFQISKSDKFEFKDGMKKEELNKYILDIITDPNTKELNSTSLHIKEEQTDYNYISLDNYFEQIIKTPNMIIVDKNKNNLENGIYIYRKRKDITIIPDYICYIRNGKIERMELIVSNNEHNDIQGIAVMTNVGKLDLCKGIIQTENSFKTSMYTILLGEVLEVSELYYYIKDNELVSSVLMNSKKLENYSEAKKELMNRLNKYLVKHNLDKNKIKNIVKYEGDGYEQPIYYIEFENQEDIFAFSFRENDSYRREDVTLESFYIPTEMEAIPTLEEVKKYDGKIIFSSENNNNSYSILVEKILDTSKNKKSQIVNKINCGIKTPHNHIILTYDSYDAMSSNGVSFILCEKQSNFNTNNLIDSLFNFDVKQITLNNLIDGYREQYGDFQVDIEAKYNFNKENNIFSIFEEITYEVGDDKEIVTTYLLNENKTIIEEYNIDTGTLTKKEEKGIVPNVFLTEMVELKHLFKNNNN